MNAAEEVVAKFLLGHLGLTISLIALGASVKVANLLAKKWPIPPKDAKWYVRAAHFLLVNWPAWESELEGEVRTLGVPTQKAYPFISVTARPPVDSVEKAREILKEPKPEEPKRGDVGSIDLGIMMCIGVIGFLLVLVFGCGCAPTKGYIRALQVKGEVSDVVVDAHVGWSQLRQTMHDNIRTSATSYQDGLAQLDKVRSTEAKVDAALIVGREAVRKYSEALAAVDAAKRKDWNGLIMEVVTAITTMVGVLSEFGVSVKWAPPTVESKPVTQAVQRGYAREMARAAKCYSFFSEPGGGVRFRQVGCEFASLGGAK
jgi:hypothetical protein